MLSAVIANHSRKDRDAGQTTIAMATNGIRGGASDAGREPAIAGAGC
jgi:hypothetical protein